MKIQLSTLFSEILCSLDANSIDTFRMCDVKDIAVRSKKLFEKITGTTVEIENDCFKNGFLTGNFEGIAQEVLPGVWTINNELFMDVVCYLMSTQGTRSKDEKNFINLCAENIERNSEALEKNAKIAIFEQTQKLCGRTKDENLTTFSKWLEDNKEKVHDASVKFFEEKNNCVFCGKYILRAPKQEENEN